MSHTDNYWGIALSEGFVDNKYVTYHQFYPLNPTTQRTQPNSTAEYISLEKGKLKHANAPLRLYSNRITEFCL